MQFLSRCTRIGYFHLNRQKYVFQLRVPLGTLASSPKKQQVDGKLWSGSGHSCTLPLESTSNGLALCCTNYKTGSKHGVLQIPPRDHTVGQIQGSSAWIINSKFHTSCNGLYSHVNKTDDVNATVFNSYKYRYLSQAPLPALMLGFSGLIPFASAALYSVASGTICTDILYAQMAYGATILSFLGGVRWGLTLSDTDVKPDWLNLTYSVTPALVAWFGLLLDPGAGLICLIAGLSGAAIIDIQLSGYPAWFKSLRFYLSSGAALSLFVSLVFYCRSPKRQTGSTLHNFKKYFI